MSEIDCDINLIGFMMSDDIIQLADIKSITTIERCIIKSIRSHYLDGILYLHYASADEVCLIALDNIEEAIDYGTMSIG